MLCMTRFRELSALVFLFQFLPAFAATSRPRVVDLYVKAIQANRPDEAYALLASKDQAAVTLDQFRLLVASHLFDRIGPVFG